MYALARRGKNSGWLDDFFDNFWLDGEVSSRYYPNVDIHEDESNLYVDADLPGLDKKDIKIKVEDHVLTLSGERNNKKEEKKKGFYRCERQYGSFERSFHLGDNIDGSKATAEFDKGVLKITIPKKEEVKPKTIDININ